MVRQRARSQCAYSSALSPTPPAAACTRSLLDARSEIEGEAAIRAAEAADTECKQRDGDGNRKRKSQNPTKRPHLELDEAELASEDSASDEGFPDPMMEDDDDLETTSSGPEDH